MKKYIFIIDLDSTIIGNCKFQLIYYKYMSIINNNINIINNSLSPYYKEELKLIRPDFINFIKKMREIYKNNVYFYIYTASSEDWANIQIKLIEKNNNIKFNRPIFTRKDCYVENNNIYKNVNNIINKIKVKDYDIIIIDDNEVYKEYNKYVIKCKPYNYSIFCDYQLTNLDFEKLPLNIRKKIINIIKCPSNFSHCIDINRIKLYKWLYNKCKRTYKENKEFENDKFWSKLSKLIEVNKIIDYNEDTIKQLTKLSNKI